MSTLITTFRKDVYFLAKYSSKYKWFVLIRDEVRFVIPNVLFRNPISLEILKQNPRFCIRSLCAVSVVIFE